ncbi:PH domain-containing protein [Nocardia sp. NBC_01327]|uniref:PH domain-containing protein n=1 Tax=Nocardia sp. NBC_01327 TaxID=2903593 RepID=UPI002E1179F0|nr:PH domain-containing protein [Nocardia sp. NBC_01327]
MPVVRIWKRDGGAEEPRRTPDTSAASAQSKAGESEVSGAEVSGVQSKSTPEGEETDGPAPSGAQWDLEVRPQHAIMTSRIIAAVLFLAFAVGGIFMRTGSTGVNFRLADQLALILFGLLLAGSVLMLTRPRVRVGKQGVVVRNILGDNEFGWQDIRGISFADKKSWARLELVHDEYVPMMAIRTNDKLRAAAAMDRFRELGAKYTAGNPA